MKVMKKCHQSSQYPASEGEKVEENLGNARKSQKVGINEGGGNFSQNSTGSEADFVYTSDNETNFAKLLMKRKTQKKSVSCEGDAGRKIPQGDVIESGSDYDSEEISQNNTAQTQFGGVEIEESIFDEGEYISLSAKEKTALSKDVEYLIPSRDSTQSESDLKYLDDDKESDTRKFDSQDISSSNSNFEFFNPVITLDSNDKTITPKRKPPYMTEIVKFLFANEELKDPTQLPFYGNPRDSTKPMEIGPRILKVQTLTCSGLKIHKSELNVLGTEERRKMKLFSAAKEIKEYRYSLVTDEDVVIKPLQRVPPSSAVFRWFESQKYPVKKDCKKAKKIKVTVPSSQKEDDESNEECSMSLTLETTSSNDVIENFSINTLSDASANFVVDLDRITAEEIQSNSETSSKSSQNQKTLSSSNELPVVNRPSYDNSCQIKGPTLENTFAFSHSIENLKNANLDETVSEIVFTYLIYVLLTFYCSL